MQRRSKVELFERIRRDSRLEGLSIRALAHRHGVHRRMVREALASAVPAERKTPQRTATALTAAHRETVRGWLLADRSAPPKQRHTARRVWQRLVSEQGAVVAESTVRAFVAEVRRELGGGVGLVMVPQTHPPAAEAEVDFGEFKAWIGGVLVRLWMFVLRLSHSGKAVHVAYANETQESFLDGFVTAFETLGGVPGRVRCDNLKPAVARVLVGADEHLFRERLRRAGGDLLLGLKPVALQLLAAVGVEEDVIPLDHTDGLRAGVFERQARRVLEDVARPALDAQGDAGLPALHHLDGRVAVVLPREADDLDARRPALVAAPLRRPKRRGRRQSADQERCFQRRSHPRALTFKAFTPLAAKAFKPPAARGQP